MSKILIVGNWKMNPATKAEAKKIANRVKNISSKLENIESVICPPFPYISIVSPRKCPANFHIGSQSVSIQTEIGSYTGEVGAMMLNDLGVEYVIVGHSEERKRGDTDEIVSMRLKSALDSNLIPIVCIGESIRDEAGAYLDMLKEQIQKSCANLSRSEFKSIIIAYEPIWAIGAKEPMKSEDIYETSIFIKKVFADIFGADLGLKLKVLYGGAVNFRNAREIIEIGKVDGLLVGRESVNIPGFKELLKSVNQVNS
jgi:triosephosphate isomerase